MLAPERKPGFVFDVPIVQYWAEALGVATTKLPSKTKPTRRRHISLNSSRDLAVLNREWLPARVGRRLIQRRRIRRVATRVGRRARPQRRPAAVVPTRKRIRRV